MKTKTHALLYLIFLTTFISCEKEEDPKPILEQGYATTFEILTKIEWNDRNAEFQKINLHNGLEVNEYGFVGGEISLNENDHVDSTFVIETVDGLLQLYSSYFGIPSDVYLEVENELSASSNRYIGLTEYFNNAGTSNNAKHTFYLVQESLKGQEFIFSPLYIQLIFDEEARTIKIDGHWIPDAILPLNVNYSLKAAMDIAADHYSGKVVKSSWKVDANNIVSERVFYVKSYPEKIIICDCWSIMLLTSSGNLYPIIIDTQTGNVIN